MSATHFCCTVVLYRVLDFVYVVVAAALTTCNVLRVNDIVVPLFDSHGQMKRAHDAYRTRIMIALMLVGSLLCYLAMVSGRRLRDAGYNLEDEGEKQVAIWKEKARLELEAQKKKSAE